MIFFGARDDVLWTQPGDGYAAMAGGVKTVSTDAQASLFGGKSVGTIPHALIAAFGGDTVKATQALRGARSPTSTSSRWSTTTTTACKTSIDVAQALEGRLWGVRLDTAENHGGQVDRLADGQLQADRRERAARVERAQRARRRGLRRREDHRRPAASTSRGSRDFEEDGVPVDAYGVGAALFDGRFDFTADIVQVNGKPQAKAGRKLRENSRLERVK